MKLLNELKSKIKKRSAFDYCLYSGIIALGIFLDQLTKWLAEKFLFPLGKSVTVIPHLAKLTYAENRGAAFGSMEDSRWIFMVTSTLLILVLGAYLYLGLAENKLYAVSVAMIISGGIGNMIDRIFFEGLIPKNAGLKVVRDFIDFSDIGFPAIFNGADSFVCVGAGILMLALVLDIIKESKGKKTDGSKQTEEEEEGAKQ